MTVLPELERQLVEAAAGPSAPPRPARRRARVGGWLAIAASAAVVIGVVVVFAAVGGQAPRLSAAQAQLERAAKTAAGTPTPALGPGQGWYTHIVGKIAWGPDYTGSYDSYSWIVATGKGFGQGDSQSSGSGRQPSAGTELGLGSTTPGYGNWNVRSIRDFPADASGVIDTLRADLPKGVRPDSFRTLAQLAAVLATEPLSGASRAAAFLATEQLPGLRYLGPVRDQLGRSGVAVAARTDQGPSGLSRAGSQRYEFQMIFDPSTGIILGSRTVVVQAPQVRGIHAGDVLVTWAYTRPKVAAIPAGVAAANAAVTPAGRRAIKRSIAPYRSARARLNRPGGPCHAGSATRGCQQAVRALRRRAEATLQATLKRLAGDG